MLMRLTRDPFLAFKMLGLMFVKINVNELFNVSYDQIKTYIITYRKYYEL